MSNPHYEVSSLVQLFQALKNVLFCTHLPFPSYETKEHMNSKPISDTK
jgi:hypothetical protein